MSQVMDEEIKRWTARRKSALVLEIIQGKTTVAIEVERAISGRGVVGILERLRSSAAYRS